MTFTAMTAPLASEGMVAGILMMAMITMVVVTVSNTVSLLPKGLSSYYLSLRSTYDCRDRLEYCSPLKDDIITWPSQDYALRL